MMLRKALLPLALLALAPTLAACDSDDGERPGYKRADPDDRQADLEVSLHVPDLKGASALHLTFAHIEFKRGPASAAGDQDQGPVLGGYPIASDDAPNFRAAMLDEAGGQDGYDPYDRDGDGEEAADATPAEDAWYAWADTATEITVQANGGPVTLGLGDLPAGNYSTIRLTLTDASAEADSGDQRPVRIESTQRGPITIGHSFELSPGQDGELVITLADDALSQDSDGGFVLRPKFEAAE